MAEGTWPAIVDRPTHEQLKAALAPKPHRKGPRPRKYALAGILRCGLCGGPLRSLIRENVEELVLGMLADPSTRDVPVALQPEEVDGDVVSIGEQVRGIQTRRERLVDLYVGGDLDKSSYRRRADELDAELHGAELAFADRLTHKTLVGIPTTLRGA